MKKDNESPDKGERFCEALLTFLAIFAIALAVTVCLTGCATKTRSVDLDGMYVSEAGTLAIGSVEVMAAPQGEESASIRYAEDTAWLSPTTKTHAITIMLTGTHSVASAKGIVADICSAFTAHAVAPQGQSAAIEPVSTNAAPSAAGDSLR